MGRYYAIELTPSSESSPGASAQSWTSYPILNGQPTLDPGALNVQLDLLAADFATPVGNCTVTIEGISLPQLFQAQQYTNMQIQVYGGMKTPGLPLALPPNSAAKAGLLITGSVFQSFGNWVGTDMNLNLVVIPSLYTYHKAGNIVLNWKSGESLQDALTTTLQTAYPGSGIVVHIAGTYSTSTTITHACQTLSQLAQWLKSYTSGSASSGVDIAMQSNGTILVWDGTVSQRAVQINFFDLIGQPQWVNPQAMQFTTVMRSDIQIGTFVTMPQGLPGAPGAVTTLGQSLPSQAKYQIAFQGTFIIQSVRHIGNSRDADGASWCSIYQAVPYHG